MSKWLEAARPVRAAMDAAGLMLSDQQASTVTALYPAMHFDGALIAAGTRINWNGRLMQARSDLWDREENTPDAAPDLWLAVQYREGIRVIPQVPTAQDAFGLGEKGWWGDVLYESLIAANVYTPEAYPDGWKAVA